MVAEISTRTEHLTLFFSLDENEIVLSCWGWEGWNTMHASTQMRSGRNEVKR